MTDRNKSNSLSLLVVAALTAGVTLGGAARADDWPQWGHDRSKNMVSGAKGLPSRITSYNVCYTKLLRCPLSCWVGMSAPSEASTFPLIDSQRFDVVVLWPTATEALRPSR